MMIEKDFVLLADFAGRQIALGNMNDAALLELIMLCKKNNPRFKEGIFNKVVLMAQNKELAMMGN